jgi:hypothetical protein
MNGKVARVVDEVIARLLPELRSQVGDKHAKYAATALPGGDDADVLDVLVQAPESRTMFALWHREGLPTSCDDPGFAAVATCTRAPDGSIVARFEEVRSDEKEEPYELVRILVAFRSDGLVVTINRYAEPGPEAPAEPWAFETLLTVALAPAWLPSA